MDTLIQQIRDTDQFKFLIKKVWLAMGKTSKNFGYTDIKEFIKSIEKVHGPFTIQQEVKISSITLR